MIPWRKEPCDPEVNRCYATRGEWETKYGRFMTLNKTFLLLVCPVRFLVIATVWDFLWNHHCYSLHKTESRLHTTIQTGFHAEAFYAPENPFDQQSFTPTVYDLTSPHAGKCHIYKNPRFELRIHNVFGVAFLCDWFSWFGKCFIREERPRVWGTVYSSPGGTQSHMKKSEKLVRKFEFKNHWRRPIRTRLKLKDTT